MTGRRSRLALLEAKRPPQPVRVVITRHIIEGGARREGEGLDVARIIRREFVLYPDGVRK